MAQAQLSPSLEQAQPISLVNRPCSSFHCTRSGATGASAFHFAESGATAHCRCSPPTAMPPHRGQCSPQCHDGPPRAKNATCPAPRSPPPPLFLLPVPPPLYLPPPTPRSALHTPGTPSILSRKSPSLPNTTIPRQQPPFSQPPSHPAPNPRAKRAARRPPTASPPPPAIS